MTGERSTLRGTRRTLRFASAMGVGVVVVAFAFGGVLGWGLWLSLHGQREAVPLMTLPTAAVTPAARPAPSVPPAGAVEIVPHAAAPPVAEPPVAEPAPPTLAPEPLRPVEAPTFDGRPIRPVRTLSMRVTAYSPDERSCGIWADGVTASGYSVWTNGGRLVAADTSLLPFGSLVSIPGYHGGQPVPVLDRGGAIKGHRLDLLYPTHERALLWGVQQLDVTVWEYAD